MISIIIASVNERYRDAIQQNIAATIGVPYELMIIPNQAAPTGLCKLYNDAAGRAQYAHLVFMHEDLEFNTENWGQQLVRHLQQPGVGAAGLAGPLYYPALPVPLLSDDSARVMYMKQGKGPGHDSAVLHSYNPQGAPTPRQVVAVDGCFIAVSKTVWEQHPFNEALLTGFHFYDLDFTLRLTLNGYRNIVFFDILISHFSGGSYQKSWFTEGEKFWHHWKAKLPLYIQPPSRRQVRQDYWKCLFHYCWNLQRAGLGKGYLLKQFVKFAFRRRYFSVGLLALSVLQPVYHRLHQRFPRLFTRKEIFS